MRERRREVQEVGWLVEVKYNSRRILALSALGQGHGRLDSGRFPNAHASSPIRMETRPRGRTGAV